MIYYTSDIHFYDEKIRRVCGRPFDSVESMNQAIIKNWNIKVSDSDTVYILGDVFPCDGTNIENILTLLKKLNGSKVLIEGNHDIVHNYAIKELDVFAKIHQIETIIDNDEEVVMCHYPMLSWANDEQGSVHLYGHIHNKDLPQIKEYYQDKKAFNVGQDVRNYMPVSLEEILRSEK